MTKESLTLMAVHAHPDDEALGTGGVLARYSDEGVRTVLVTCTNGELGDGRDGAKPGEAGHDEAEVVKLRRQELEASCAVLGVTHLELLGYRDSGMDGWPQNSAAGAFWTTPVEQAAARLGALMEKYQPQVVITYDDKGLYQPPDHVHASLSAQAAVAATGIPAKLYLSAIRGSDFQKIREALREMGLEGPGDDEEFTPEMRERMVKDEQRITTSVDVSSALQRKRDALMAHASQIEESWFSKIPEDLARASFGHEHFIRASDTTGAPLPESDLFAGLR